MKKGYLIIFVLLIGVMGCTSSKKATNENNPIPERVFDNIDRMQAEVILTVTEAMRSDNGYSSAVRIDRVVQVGPSTPNINAGNEFPLLISDSILSQTGKSTIAVGDTFTALIEIERPGVGESQPRVNLVSIKN